MSGFDANVERGIPNLKFERVLVYSGTVGKEWHGEVMVENLAPRMESFIAVQSYAFRVRRDLYLRCRAARHYEIGIDLLIRRRRRSILMTSITPRRAAPQRKYKSALGSVNVAHPRRVSVNASTHCGEVCVAKWFAFPHPTERLPPCRILSRWPLSP